MAHTENNRMKFFVVYKKVSDNTISGAWVTSTDQKTLFWHFNYPVDNSIKLDIIYLFKIVEKPCSLTIHN